MKFRNLVMAITAFSMMAIPQSKSVFTGTTLTGYTYQLIGKNDYRPLSGVTVQVFRRGIVAHDKSSDKDVGRFRIDVPEGEPFLVLFSGQDIMPELQQLAGKKGLVDEVHIAMLTLEQYIKIWGVPATKDKLSWINNELSRIDGTETAQVKKEIDDLLNKLKSLI